MSRNEKADTTSSYLHRNASSHSPKINLGSTECSLYFKAMFLVAYCSFYSFVNLISSNRAVGALPSTYLQKYIFYTVTS